MDPVIIEEYSSAWEEVFQKLKKIYETKLGNLILSIEHVGSTSVLGLCAKPIIDIDIVIDSYEVFDEIVMNLKELGYSYEGELGIKDRHAFKRDDDRIPFNNGIDNWMQHHLYVCPKDSREYKRHIAFRNYLRNNSHKAKEYCELKKKLAKLYRNDRETYCEMKTNFVEEVLNICKVNEK